jgi:hypothetical protein
LVIPMGIMYGAHRKTVVIKTQETDAVSAN